MSESFDLFERLAQTETGRMILEGFEESQRQRDSAARQQEWVAEDGWIAQRDAAVALGVSMARIAFLILSGTLTPAHSPNGRAGVSRRSVEALAARRRNAPRGDASPGPPAVDVAENDGTPAEAGVRAVGVHRLELWTSSVSRKRSSQLSYTPERRTT